MDKMCNFNSLVMLFFNIFYFQLFFSHRYKQQMFHFRNYISQFD